MLDDDNYNKSLESRNKWTCTCEDLYVTRCMPSEKWSVNYDDVHILL
jgi:hypothetical protein